MKKQDYYPAILLGIFLIIWVLLALSPNYRSIWLDENILSVGLVVLLVATYHKFRFSNFSYTLLFFFLVLHTIGSHYTYAEMPLFDAVKETFDLSRNHYDRVVHFLFGIVFYFPIYEFLSRKLNVKGWWKYFLPFMLIIALKGIYEVLEVGYHLVRESKLVENNFLGMQGDTWDAQKDMFLGMIGAGISWLVLGITEWGNSGRGKDKGK